MTQEEKRRLLIHELLSESPQYKNMVIPADQEKQKQLLRSLMNLRPPHPISSSFLRIQDEYLQEEVIRKGITDVNTLSHAAISKRIFLWQGDMTTLKADAIVNAANSALLGCFVPCHGCIDNMIHSVSGIQLRLACHELMKNQNHEEAAGQAKITPGFNLPSRYVLHTVGPIVSGILTDKHSTLLANCYLNCLKLAAEMHLKSIAFCCISTGEFHFPQKAAAQIAVETVTEFLKTDTQIERVIFNVYKQQDYDIYKRILG